MIDRVRSFLTQPVRNKTNFDETVAQIKSITDMWDEALNIGTEINNTNNAKN